MKHHHLTHENNSKSMSLAQGQIIIKQYIKIRTKALKIFIFLFLLSFNALADDCTETDHLNLDDLKSFDFSCFDEQVQKQSAIGWTLTNGGRSWTNQDLQNFHDYLDKLALNEDGKKELMKWGIPVDCFDALIVLHALFAYKNGLYIHYNYRANSINYAHNPKKLFKAIIEYGTSSSHKITYEVDLWDKG